MKLFGPLVHKDPDCMDYLKRTKMVFPSDLSYLWSALLSMNWQNFFRRPFNQFKIYFPAIAPKILFLSLKKCSSSLLTQMIAFSVPSTPPVCSLMYLWLKLFKFVLTPSMTAIFHLHSFPKKILLSWWTSLLPLLSSVLITLCTSKLMVL